MHTFVLHIRWALAKYGNLGGKKTKVERENLWVEYIRYGLAIESGRVIWIEDS